MNRSLNSVFVFAVIRPHLRSDKRLDEYSSLDSVNNCSMESSNGSKNKLSSVSVTSLSAEEEAFEQCYQRRSHRSPLRAFVDDRIFRRRHNIQPARQRDSLDSSASATSRLGLHNNAFSSDTDSPNHAAGDRLLSREDRGSSQSHASVADEVFDVDNRRYLMAKLPPTPETRKVRKHRAFSTPDSHSVSTRDSKPQACIPVPSSHTLSTDNSNLANDGAIGGRATITPDILAEIEMYRCMVCIPHMTL